MKVKPFYIEITAGMTADDIGKVLDTCVKYGAKPYEQAYGYESDYDYEDTIGISDWVYFGVEDAAGMTYFSDNINAFGKEAVLITLYQLPAHLGLVPENDIDRIRSWEGKKPVDMTNGELKEFFCDRVDATPMEFCGERKFKTAIFNTHHGAAIKAKYYEDSYYYRIKRVPKPSENEIKIAELEATAEQLQQQIKELKQL